MRWCGITVGVALLAMIAIPGKGCGPYFLEMTFVNPDRPEDLQGFVGGRPWILQATYRVRSLALAYRVLNGPALTEEERKNVVAANARQEDGGPWPEPTDEGLNRWKKVYQDFAGRTAPVEITDRKVPGVQWQEYSNCQEDAFATAAKTLLQRQREYAAAKPDLNEWLRGQDAVFSNCGGGQQLPAELSASSPVWLRKDRVYQLAAAHFYRSEWKDAEAAFASIEADTASPWHEVAGYLVGRTLIRESTLSPSPDMSFDPVTVRAAETQLKRVASGSGPYADNASQLLNLVELRLHPGQAVARLGDFISKPDKHLAQHLIDLRMGFDNGWEDKVQRADACKSDLVDWIITMRFGNYIAIKPPHYAVERWRATHNVVWLVAALNGPERPDEDLLAAAAAVPQSSPAWPTVTYVRLSWMGADAAVWNELLRDRDTLIARHALTSTVNQFTALALQRAPSIEEFAHLAPMDPAGSRLYESDYVPLQSPGKDGDQDGQPVATMGGLPVNVAGVKRLDVATTAVLNDRLPLSMLVPMVLNSDWPKQLRFETAMAVWTRAVLLDRPEQARQLTPIMVDGEPGWKQWLTAYDAATTDDARRVTGLLALMRFPSVRPYVNAGAGREEGFVGYSGYRDNWWCAGMGKQQNWMDSYSTSYNYRGGGEMTSPQQKLPEQLPAFVTLTFVTLTMASQARQEQAQLMKIGDAPAHFGKQAIDWVKAHPTDPRDPELLGFAFRAMRNGCNLENSTGLRRQVFQTLHAGYPQSDWARHYPTFETDPE
jgi:hypothetical protein